MRAIRLPSTLSVCAEPRAHFVVAATDSCRSFESFKHQQQQRGRMRVDGLLPDDWAALLQCCRALTSPLKAYNFTSPGDMSGGGGAAAVENGAYMHIVERGDGDFEPNNLIYHHLQQYTLQGGKGGSRDGFGDVVRRAQGGGAQPPAEWATLSPEAATPAAAKMRSDPLAEDAEAQAKSAANMAIDTADTSAAPTFTFYPFPCPVAASIPYRSKHFCVMVNLKPIVPNHLMVVPLRCVGTVHGLTEEEVRDWGRTVALTVRVLNEARRREAAAAAATAAAATAASEMIYSVAIQQGAAAGQTVPHLHTHIIPFDPEGKLAGEPESEEAEQRSRPPRTLETMQEETEVFKAIFAELEHTVLSP